MRAIKLAAFLVFICFSAKGQGIHKIADTALAQRAALDAQIRFYEDKKDTGELLRYNVEKIEKYGMDTAGFGKLALNNIIYFIIFRHCSDTAVLMKAAGWMKMLISTGSPDPDFLDTYANLLYKLGKRDDAIQMEKKAVQLEPDSKDIQDNYNKMRNKEITWANK
jgi:tetratricopeptide (TPR) repeat protein